MSFLHWFRVLMSVDPSRPLLRSADRQELIILLWRLVSLASLHHCIEFKVLFLVLKSQLSCAPKYLCDHIRPPISASSVSTLCNDMIFSCLVLRQPWPTPGPLLLLVSHSGITFLLFSLVYSLCSTFLVSLSLALSLTFFLDLKCTESASVWLTLWEALYKYLYTIQYNIQYNSVIEKSISHGSTEGMEQASSWH